VVVELCFNPATDMSAPAPQGVPTSTEEYSKHATEIYASKEVMNPEILQLLRKQNQKPMRRV